MGRSIKKTMFSITPVSPHYQSSKSVILVVGAVTINRIDGFVWFRCVIARLRTTARKILTSYGTKLPVGITTRRYLGNLRSWSFECILPAGIMGGKQNLAISVRDWCIDSSNEIAKVVVKVTTIWE